MKPVWIWRSNDFELYFYHLMTKRRKQRETTTYPFWSMDRPDYNAMFTVDYSADKDSFFSVMHSGEIIVRINDNQVFSEAIDGKYFLPAGKGTITISCFEEKTFPMIFVDSEYLTTGNHWKVLLLGNRWVNASCLDMFSSKEKSPLTFKLDSLKIYPVKTSKRQDGVLYDFGRELMGTPKILLSKEEKFTFYYGESEEEALDADCCEVISTHVSKLNEYSYPSESKGFRFLFAKTDAEIIDFFVEEEKYIPSFNPYFVSNDEQLNKIYEVAKYTLELTSREFFIDGIKRDRWVWAGDVLQSEWFDFYSFNDKEIVKRSLRALIGNKPIHSNINSILDYNFYFVLSVYYYYYFTGDIEFVQEMFPRLESLMSFVFSKPHKNNLLQAHNEWIFIDWTEIKDFAQINNAAPICLIQILYWASLKIMVEFSNLLNIKTEVYEERKCKLEKEIVDTYFDNKIGFYHDVHKTLLTKYGNMFSILLGFANKNQVDVIKGVDESKFEEIYTPYMKFYESCMLAENGQIERVVDYLKSYWGGMINEGATTFWETYNPEEKGPEKYAMYDRKYGKSLCHSWGAGPLYLIGKYIVGLSPAEVGYSTYKLNPHISNLTYKCELPINDGSIQIEFDGEYLTIHSANKDGILVSDKFVADNLVYDNDKKGYQLKRGVLYKLRLKRDCDEK